MFPTPQLCEGFYFVLCPVWAALFDVVRKLAIYAKADLSENSSQFRKLIHCSKSLQKEM